jgi:DNA polymerase III subunit chi
VLRIDFHTHVDNRLDYACRLTRRAYTAGESLFVVAPSQVLHEIDLRLWTFSALDFIPHCRFDDAYAKTTPVILSVPNDKRAATDHILLNLDLAVPPDFLHARRILEVVGNEASEIASARERYRFYRARGYTLHSHRQHA